jgi:predicted nucleotidyltransferase component of viral defense system
MNDWNAGLVQSIMDRLKNQARSRGVPFNEVLTYYVLERFLYRLSKSKHRNDFVLKGALLMSLWLGGLSRSTRDIDLRGFVPHDPAQVTKIFKEICDVRAGQDGLIFESGSIRTDTIREGASYVGLRVHLQANLGKARIPFRVDIGFTDPIVPDAETAVFPTILDFDAPTVRVYPVATVNAEKVETIVQLGALNSRMKDFFDLHYISLRFELDGKQLADAVQATFTSRGSRLPAEPTVGFSTSFGESNQALWRAFLKRGRIATSAPQELRDVLKDLRVFLGPLLKCMAENRTFEKTWRPGRGWQ